MNSVYFIIIFIITFSLIMSIILSYFEKTEKKICNELEEYLDTDETVTVDNEENNMNELCNKSDNKDFSSTIVVENIESLYSKVKTPSKSIEMPQLSPYSIVDDDII